MCLNERIKKGGLNLHNDLTFFTNEPERNLYERFNKILNSNTQFFDILVGYFRISGFYRLYPAMENVEKIRVLVGINADKKIAFLVKEGGLEARQETFSYKEVKNDISRRIIKEFETSDDTFEVNQGIQKFIEWIKTGKMEVRVYPEEKIHAKVYIMRKDMKKVPDTYGSVITGSSNFSESGLINNLEFNVELKDSRDVEFALDHFEKLWMVSVPLSDTYIGTVEDNTWFKKDITPYELYLKTLYEYFREELDFDREEVEESLLPKGYLRLQYQYDAVVQARKILDKYNGVFISDVVGLGKTYVCAMLAKSLNTQKILIICPPVLVDYWRSVMEEFGVIAEVESLGKLDNIISDGAIKYEYVFIDEAHRFRNQNTERFKKLHEICFNKKVILITATPINNYSSDIENQIYLFQSKQNSTIIPGYKNIGLFFKQLDKELKKYDKGTVEYYNQLKRNSEEIRDKVLRHIMIRRTRHEIMEYYSDDLKKQGLSFPTLETPRQIVYELDENLESLFLNTMEIIKKLTYSRYTPLLYLKCDKKYSSLKISQHNMSGFMKSILVKRLESSFFAFKMTLERFIQSYESFLNMCYEGTVYIGKKINVSDLLDIEDDEELLEVIDRNNIQKFDISEFNEEFIDSLESDLDMFRNLKKFWSDIKVDPKINILKKELKDNKLLINSKIIIFSESKETANYIGGELKKYYGERLVVHTGESSVKQKQEIEKSFNPKYVKSEHAYDILITTDVLSEGINLHQSNILINYDLPWNPTKIMQRVGRINRVGTVHDKIFVFNFFPTSQTTKHLPLKDRIIEKLQLFHDTLGEDFKYLSESEQVSSHKLYKQLTDNLAEEKDNFNSELRYIYELRGIRDSEPALYEKIIRIPDKSRVGKTSNIVNGDATITFFRKGLNKTFYKTESGETTQLNFINAIKYIESSKEECAEGLEKDYFRDLKRNKDAFLTTINDNKIFNQKSGGLSKADKDIIKILKAIVKYNHFIPVQKDQILKFLSVWENGNVSQKLSSDILKKLKSIKTPLEVFECITNSLPSTYLIDNKSQHLVELSSENEIILSCYIKKI